MSFTEEQLREIESQLSHPKGEMGKEMGLNMNVSNKAMTSATIDLIDAKTHQSILEIGHGNCAHLAELLSKTEGICFTGLEISEIMHEEAKRINTRHLETSSVNFKLYNGTNIPFEASSFESVYTVNTIYFWKNPIVFLNEIYRVLKSDGICAIAFAKKEFMATLPFVKDKFQNYGNDEINHLVMQSSFTSVDITEREDSVFSKDGEPVLRKFGIAILKKI